MIRDQQSIQTPASSTKGYEWQYQKFPRKLYPAVNTSSIGGIAFGKRFLYRILLAVRFRRVRHSIGKT
jgi:hypothetical protein